MIRALIKLSTLALAGYAAYSLYDLVANGAEEVQEGNGSRGQKRGGRSSAGNGSGGRGRATGGKTEMTGEGTGTAVSHRVGRGVVPR